MKRMIWMTCFAFFVLEVCAASAQSLGDYARDIRKNKTQQSSTSHHYDNDNLPTDDHVSVVGPAPTAPAESSQSAPANANATKTEGKKASDDLRKKISDQKQKIDALNHELDLDQREYRLRAAMYYANANSKVNPSTTWDKDESQYRSDIETKQKAMEDARQQLEELQEEGRKAGLTEQEQSGNDKTDKSAEQQKTAEEDKDKDSDKTQGQGQSQSQSQDQNQDKSQNQDQGKTQNQDQGKTQNQDKDQTSDKAPSSL